MLAPVAFESRARGAKFHEANDHETEVWRACQRFSTSADKSSITVLLMSDAGRTSGVFLLVAHESR